MRELGRESSLALTDVPRGAIGDAASRGQVSEEKDVDEKGVDEKGVGQAGDVSPDTDDGGEVISIRRSRKRMWALASTALAAAAGIALIVTTQGRKKVSDTSSTVNTVAPMLEQNMLSEPMPPETLLSPTMRGDIAIQEGDLQAAGNKQSEQHSADKFFKLGFWGSCQVASGAMPRSESVSFRVGHYNFGRNPEASQTASRSSPRPWPASTSCSS